MPIPYGGPNDPVQKWMDEWVEELPQHVLESMASLARSGQRFTVPGLLAQLAMNEQTHILKRAAQDLLSIFKK
ncbi:MAG: hypothetical protein EBV06_01430 [Planctomycetia bacterium]|nr:hypothetical protein [Planctomycetia bacterium]